MGWAGQDGPGKSLGSGPGTGKNREKPGSQASGRGNAREPHKAEEGLGKTLRAGNQGRAGERHGSAKCGVESVREPGRPRKGTSAEKGQGTSEGEPGNHTTQPFFGKICEILKKHTKTQTKSTNV